MPALGSACLPGGSGLRSLPAACISLLLTLPLPLPPQEYNTEAAFAAAVLLSVLALFTLVVKDRLEGVAARETEK